MTKHDMRNFIRTTYAAHMRWVNVVQETDISTDIEMFYMLSRTHWNAVCDDITLHILRAQYDILGVVEG